MPEWVQKLFKIIWPDSTTIEIHFPGNLRYMSAAGAGISYLNWPQEYFR